MNESRLTKKGRTTVPAKVRKRLGIKSGTRLAWHVLPTGAILVRAKTGSLLELAGMPKPSKGRHVAVEKTNAWR